MVKLIGYLFVALYPFVGGMVPFVLLVLAGLINGDQFAMWFVGYGWVWLLAYCLWFDGSRFQRDL